MLRRSSIIALILALVASGTLWGVRFSRAESDDEGEADERRFEEPASRESDDAPRAPAVNNQPMSAPVGPSTDVGSSENNNANLPVLDVPAPVVSNPVVNVIDDNRNGVVDDFERLLSAP